LAKKSAGFREISDNIYKSLIGALSLVLHVTANCGNTLFPLMLPCLLWLVSLFVAVLYIVFLSFDGSFFKISFLLGRLCKLFDKALVCGLACGALAMDL
jgi:hypothetical protein